jgi:hypothetical protein
MERSDDCRHTEASKPGLRVSLSLPARDIFPLKVAVFFATNLPKESGMANFIVLKRPGPPSREVLVNLDQILMVQPGQGTGGSAILFDREHLVTFEEDFATVIRRIQNGPYIEPGRASPPK